MLFALVMMHPTSRDQLDNDCDMCRKIRFKQDLKKREKREIIIRQGTLIFCEETFIKLHYLES